MSASLQPRTQIRAMRPSDLKAVAAVESSSYQFPWSIGIVRDCLLAGYYSQVLEFSGAISAYSIMSVAGAEAHLLNLCVHPSCQRLGFGRRPATATPLVQVFDQGVVLSTDSIHDHCIRHAASIAEITKLTNINPVTYL